jgi:PAS domain S-box-containing protein
MIGGLAAVLVYAALRFAAAARDTRRHSRESGSDVAILSAALHDAVTKLKAQERATAARAEASERLSSEIVSSLTAGLLVVDLAGAVTILNPAGRRMLDLPDRDYVRAPREQPLWDVIEECLRTGVAVVRRSIALDQVGGGVHLGVTVSPIRDGAGELQGAICLFTDLTAIEALEEQLRLKESLATVGELTAGIAHEFRNGLATILGYSKLFDLSALPEAYREYVRGIRSETESLSQVVTNFLNFARPAQLTVSRVDVGALCERAAEEIRGDVEAAGGRVSVRGTFGDVDGDEVLLRQAFSNLLRNAVEACTDAGVVPDVVVLSDVDRGQQFSRVSVNDNGPGIPAGSREQVFRPFFTSKRSGTGLGLALVQKIVVSHNGRIVVGDAPQGGASLQVMLPLAR